MPIKDPTSDLAIIARKGSVLVREIHEKQSMNKSRQRFWELAGSKLGEILGVQKTAEQVDLCNNKLFFLADIPRAILLDMFQISDRC